MGERPKIGWFGKDADPGRRAALKTMLGLAVAVPLAGCDPKGFSISPPEAPNFQENDFHGALNYLGGRVLTMRDTISKDRQTFQKQGISVTETTLGDGPTAHRLVTLRELDLSEQDGEKTEKVLQVEISSDGKSTIYGFEFGYKTFIPEGTDSLTGLNGQYRAQMRQDSTGVKTIITQQIATEFVRPQQDEKVYETINRYATNPNTKIAFFPNDSFLDLNNLPATFSKDTIVKDASGEKVLPIDGIPDSSRQSGIKTDSPFDAFNAKAFSLIGDIEQQVNSIL